MLVFFVCLLAITYLYLKMHNSFMQQAAIQSRGFQVVNDRILHVRPPASLMRLALTDRLPERIRLEATPREAKAFRRIVREGMRAKLRGDSAIAREAACKLDSFIRAKIDGMAEGDVWSRYALAEWPFGQFDELDALRVLFFVRVHGRSLDLASGRSPYYTPSIAIDSNLPMLLRNPARVRILADLDGLGRGEELPFKNAFDTVTLCFAEIYLEQPALVYAQARHALKPGGRLLVLNGKRRNGDAARRVYEAEQTTAFLKEAGFPLVERECIFERKEDRLQETTLFTARK